MPPTSNAWAAGYSLISRPAGLFFSMIFVRGAAWRSEPVGELSPRSWASNPCWLRQSGGSTTRRKRQPGEGGRGDRPDRAGPESVNTSLDRVDAARDAGDAREQRGPARRSASLLRASRALPRSPGKRPPNRPEQGTRSAPRRARPPASSGPCATHDDLGDPPEAPRS